MIVVRDAYSGIGRLCIFNMRLKKGFILFAELAAIDFFTLTCFPHNSRELVAGHSKDDEDDQRPGDQSQGPYLKKHNIF